MIPTSHDLNSTVIQLTSASMIIINYDFQQLPKHIEWDIDMYIQAVN